MPLLEQYYTLSEALSAIRARLPDESAERNLIDALHTSRVDSFIVCAKSGKTYPIPDNVWKSTDGRFKPDFDTGMAEIQERSVVRQTPYTSKPTGSWSRDGRPLPYYIKGKVHVMRAQLDTLLDPVKPPEGKTAASKSSIVDVRPKLREWLKEQVRREKRQSKDQYYAEAKLQDGLAKLPWKQFNEVWAAMVPQEWRKAGALPKK